MADGKVARYDRLGVRAYPDRPSMGIAAARHVASAVSRVLQSKPHANMVFAAAPSQSEMLAALRMQDVEWGRVNAFHMDEYIGLPADAPQRFGHFLEEALFRHVPLRAVHLIDAGATDPQRECARYAALLEAYPVDIVCMGIGENTHIAFNDPHVADFEDPAAVKAVALDDASRRQQVNDGCFASLEAVPREALTLTVPALLRAGCIVCVVPAPSKAWAVERTLLEDVSPQYPSTVLRRHPDATLYLDADSSSRIRMGEAW